MGTLEGWALVTLTFLVISCATLFVMAAVELIKRKVLDDDDEGECEEVEKV